MAGEPITTIVGNLTSDPELRFTATGLSVANFTVASNPRFLDRQSGEWKDGETLFMRCNIWRQPAENMVESLRRGQRVIVQGRLGMRSFKTKEGEKRTVVELDVDEVGPSLRYATATVTKAVGDSVPQQQKPAASPDGDPWGAVPDPAGDLVTAGAADGDTPPF
jgi:single-strand DNA-binding protein